MSSAIDDVKLVNFRSSRVLADEAKAIIESEGITMTEAFNLFLKNVVVTKKVNLLSEEDLEKEELFKKLQKEVQESYAGFEVGQFYTDTDLVKRYGL